MRVALKIFAVLVYFATMPGHAFAAGAGHVYLIEGAAFGIFSQGLVTLRDELRQRGYKATVHQPTDASLLAAEAVALKKRQGGPVIIVGHSLGANAAITMADIMKTQGAPVALIVAFGPTYDMTVPSNVSRVIVYYQASGVVSGVASKGPGFRGTIANINLDADAELNHFNLEKDEGLHAKVIAAVRSVLGGSRVNSRTRSSENAQ